MSTWIPIAVVFVVFLAWRARARIRQQAALVDEARQAIERGAAVVDARSAMEFAGDHHPGALNLPPSQVKTGLGRLGPRQRPVVVYCASGARSRQLAQALRNAGFEKVIDVGTLAAMRALPAARSVRR